MKSVFDKRVYVMHGTRFAIQAEQRVFLENRLNGSNLEVSDDADFRKRKRTSVDTVDEKKELGLIHN